jgi:hypothetical protein
MLIKKKKILAKDKMISKTGLKLEYGFTDGMINKFLPNHDKEVENPYCKCAAPMKLYLVSRVKRIIKTKKFQDICKNSEKRREGAIKAVKTKELKAIEFAKSLDISIDKILPKDVLIQKAIYSYNEFNCDKNNFEFASLNSDSNFLNRITVNYIRHEMTDYEELLFETFGIVGKHLAINIIRRKIYDTIKNNYAWLSEECEKQMKIRLI